MNSGIEHTITKIDTTITKGNDRKRNQKETSFRKIFILPNTPSDKLILAFGLIMVIPSLVIEIEFKLLSVLGLLTEQIVNANMQFLAWYWGICVAGLMLVLFIASLATIILYYFYINKDSTKKEKSQGFLNQI